MSTQAGKDVIYIDVDDEITAIIDKVRGSGERIVALVLPKRATAFQSIVNMKLLKRTSDEAKKHLVLITSEAGLLPLAGAVGMYVAKSLQSKPEIPNAPNGNNDIEEVEEPLNMAGLAEDAPLDAKKPVGEHASSVVPSAVAPAAFADDDEPIELDDDAVPLAAASAAAAKKTGKKNKKLNIPDFNKFRVLMLVGAGALVLIIFLWYVGFVVMPRATIAVKTDSSAIHTNQDVTFNTTATEADPDAQVVPAKVQQSVKTLTQQVDATGQKDKGTKATGTVTMSAGACTGTAPDDVPAGTGLSANGLTYITQDTASFVPTIQKGKCTWVGNGSIDIAAQNNGDKYNSSSTSLTVAGRSDVSASTNGISGGTSNIVKVVAQADIDNAKQKMDQQDTSAVKTELKQALQTSGLFAVESTLSTGDPQVTSNANVGDEADNVTVTQKITYTMFGAKESDLKKLITAQVNEKIDRNKQSILDYGLTTAVFKLQNQQDTTALVTMDDTAVAGSDLNLTDIKKQVAGKKSGDAKTIIAKYPGVTNVDVSYSPFWVSSIPSKTSKITVTVEKPAVKDGQ